MAGRWEQAIEQKRWIEPRNSACPHWDASEQTRQDGQEMHKVLVIEDEPSIAMLLANIIEDYGYEVTVAFDGRQGYELARTGAYSLIITDNMLPYMSGREICGRLRNESPTKHTIIVLMSAVTQVAESQAEANAFLSKPFDITAIDQLVQNYLMEQENSRRVELNDGNAYAADNFTSRFKQHNSGQSRSYSNENRNSA